MKHGPTHELRALFLAALMVLSVAAGSVAFAGSAAASSYGLEATDGAGGNSSFLYANVSEQLPEGTSSGDDQLTLKANDPPLPNYFTATLTIDEASEARFDTDQDGSEVEAVVFGEGGSPEDAENTSVIIVDEKTVEIEVDYHGEDDEGLFLGDNEEVPAAGINVTNLRFDTGSPENATLTWDVRGEKADYTLEVDTLQTDLEATDDQDGIGAYVTAGAADQAPVGVSDGSDLVLRGDESAFPENFEVTLELGQDGITFNESADVTATSSQDSSIQNRTHVLNVTGTEVTILVTNFEPEDSATGPEEDAPIVTVEGLTVDVPAAANPENLTWSVLGKSASYELYPEQLDSEFAGDYEFPRGAAQTPEDGVTVYVDGNGKRTTGFHAEGEEMTLELPDHVNGIVFDESAEPSGQVEVGSTLDPDEDITEFTVTEQWISFVVPTQIDDTERVVVEGIRFNTTGFDERGTNESAELKSGLNATYTPVDALGDVEIETAGERLRTRAPDVEAEGKDQLSPNATGQASSVSVNVTDVVGGQMAAGEDIVIQLKGDSNVTFDESQEIGHAGIDAPKDQDFYPDVDGITVTDRKIVIPVSEGRPSSSAGDYLNVSSADGGLQFDTDEAPVDSELSFSVTTNAGNGQVTQETAPAVTVGGVDLETDTEKLTVGVEETVVVNVSDDESGESMAADVTASGEPIEDITKTSTDGTAEFVLEPSEEGTITFDAHGATPIEIDVNNAIVSTEPEIVPEGEETDVVVTLRDAEDDALEGYAVKATSDRLDSPVSGETNSSGQVTLALDPGEGEEDITVDVTDLSGVQTVVAVETPTLEVEHPQPQEITPGNATEVHVVLTDAYGEPIRGASVEATSEETRLSDSAELQNKTDEDGFTTLNVTADGPGTIKFDAYNDDSDRIANNTVEAVANIQPDSESIVTNETSEVTVMVTGADDEPQNNVKIEATGEPLSGTVTGDTNESGLATLSLNPDQAGSVTIAADELGVNAELEVIDVQLDVEPKVITPGRTTPVTATLTGPEGPVQDADVVVSGGNLAEDVNGTTNEEGQVDLGLEPSEPGTITVEASGDDFSVDAEVKAEADVELDSQTIDHHGESTVNATVTGANDEPLEGVDVVATGDPLSGPVNATTGPDGNATLSLDPQQGGQVSIAADELGVAATLEVTGPTISSTANRFNATGDEVTFSVENADGNAVKGATIYVASGPGEADNATTGPDGNATLMLETTAIETVTVEADHDTAEGFPIQTELEPVLNVTASPSQFTAGTNETVTVDVTGVDGAGLGLVDVTATGAALAASANGTTGDDGSVELDLESDRHGDVTVGVEGVDGVDDTVEAIATVEVDEKSLTEDERTDVTVTVHGAHEDHISGAEVQVSGAIPESKNATTDEAGQVKFRVKPDNEGKVNFSVDDLAIWTELTVEPAGGGGGNSATGGNGGYGGGGVGGGAAPSPSTDFNVTDVTVSTTEIQEGDTVEVTVTVANEGDADGTYEVDVEANTLTVATETVEVPQGETVEVTVPVTFANAGERKIEVGGVAAGSVDIEELEPEDLPDGATDADVRPVVDAAPDENGTVVEFDENVTVDAIVFSNATNGTATVTDLESLPAGVPDTPGPLVRAMDIEVPDELENESATIRLSLDASALDADAEDVRLGRYHDGEWQTMQPQNVSEDGGELVYQFETPGFSTFAVFAQQEDTQPTETTTTTPEATTTTTTDDGASAEEAGFGALGKAIVALVALIALLLAVAGARLYQQNEL